MFCYLVGYRKLIVNLFSTPSSLHTMQEHVYLHKISLVSIWFRMVHNQNNDSCMQRLDLIVRYPTIINISTSLIVVMPHE